jgi:hypothetical protein
MVKPLLGLEKIPDSSRAAQAGDKNGRTTSGTLTGSRRCLMDCPD